MNSISHQQRMMEIQYMSNACLVTLLPRVQESLQGANKDGSVVFKFSSFCHSNYEVYKYSFSVYSAEKKNLIQSDGVQHATAISPAVPRSTDAPRNTK